jgi:hypothetical protein
MSVVLGYRASGWAGAEPSGEDWSAPSGAGADALRARSLISAISIVPPACAPSADPITTVPATPRPAPDMSSPGRGLCAVSVSCSAREASLAGANDVSHAEESALHLVRPQQWLPHRLAVSKASLAGTNGRSNQSRISLASFSYYYWQFGRGHRRRRYRHDTARHRIRPFVGCSQIAVANHADPLSALRLQPFTRLGASACFARSQLRLPC